MEKIEETRRLLGLDVVVRRLDGDRATAENTPLLKLLDMHQEMSGNVASKKKNLNKKDMVRLLPLLLPCDNPCECVCVAHVSCLLSPAVQVRLCRVPRDEGACVQRRRADRDLLLAVAQGREPPDHRRVPGDADGAGHAVRRREDWQHQDRLQGHYAGRRRWRTVPRRASDSSRQALGHQGLEARQVQGRSPSPVRWRRAQHYELHREGGRAQHRCLSSQQREHLLEHAREYVSRTQSCADSAVVRAWLTRARADEQ